MAPDRPRHDGRGIKVLASAADRIEHPQPAQGEPHGRQPRHHGQHRHWHIHRPAQESNGSAHDSITNINQKAHAALDRASDVATQTADWLSSPQKDLTHKTCTYVQAKPMRSIGMAFAAGFVLAKLLR